MDFDNNCIVSFPTLTIVWVFGKAGVQKFEEDNNVPKTAQFTLTERLVRGENIFLKIN